MNIGQSLSNASTDVVCRRSDRGATRYDLLTPPMERLAMARFRARLIAHVIGPRVLEVGVGTGRNLPRYRTLLQIEAIDFGPHMLERARRKPLPANVTLSLMDIEQLRFAPASVDGRRHVRVLFGAGPDARICARSAASSGSHSRRTAGRANICGEGVIPIRWA